jgi:NADP-dependent 3-hydroxy acid dehydrogenase YdfG
MPEKVVVVTGASSGIGAALAELLASQGHSLALVARRKEALDAVAKRCSGRAHVIVADVTRREDVRRAVSESLSRFRQVDVWVNNAGQGISRLPSQLTDEDIDDMVRINIKSVLYGMQEILPHFKSRNDGQIVNVSSMLGRLPFALIRSAYVGAKHFMNALTAMFRQELEQTHPGIAITLVSPGVVRTDFGLNALHGGPDSRELPGAQDVDQVSKVIAGAIATRTIDVYTFPGAQQLVSKYYASLGSDP